MSARSFRNYYWPLMFLIFLCILLFFLIASHDTTKYSVLNRHWGFDNLLFYNWPLRTGLCLLLIAFLIPRTNLFLWHRIEILFLSIRKIVQYHWLLFFLISASFAFCFYYLQVRYFFLGDFNLRMNQVMQQDFVREEYLTMFGLYQLATFFAGFGVATETFFRMYSVVMGFFYVLITCHIAELSGGSRTNKILTLLLLCCSSLVLLFCGYVEIYSTPYVAMMFFVYCGLRYLKNITSFLWPLLSFILALATHMMNIAMFPSLFILYFAAKPEKLAWLRPRSQWHIFYYALILSILSAFALFMKGHYFLIPLKSPPHETRMTLFSISHFWEYFNGVLLCSGPAIIVVTRLFISSARKKLQLPATFWFSLCIAAGNLALTFSTDLQRGSGDWDLMSFSAAPLLLALALLVQHYYARESDTLKYILVFTLVFNLINAALWLHINHNRRSIKKFETMLDGDPASYYVSRISGKVQLALCFKNNKLYREAELMAAKACALAEKEDVRACLMVVERMVDGHRYEEARVYLEKLLDERTDAVYEPYIFLLPYYDQQREYEKLTIYLNRMYAAFLREPLPFLSSRNFKKEVVAGLFQSLYDSEKNVSTDTLRLKKMKNVIREIQLWQPPRK